ncbi:GNAT family N-acetyltransferase [Ferviditalea candida]|uniref:GNAT family N-acetyltransferase n=1 Tax=Ferviditalea candida TaxID=3108399 RepID=A0ABU5ZJD3_9BACL|nr:GNAT family N-acetyltransferase [Paenibacillaceae bacterium T2]
MSKLIVRYVQPIDIPKLIPLIIGYLQFYNRPVPPDEKIEEMIVRFLVHPDEGVQFAAAENGELKGFATLNYIWSTTRMQKIALLNDLYVDPEHRRKGAGEGLLNAALNQAKKENLPIMRLLTAEDNKAAQALYEKTGGKAPGWRVYDYDLSSWGGIG